MTENAAARTTVPVDAREHIPPAALVLLGLMTVFWGINFPIMKLALSQIEPWTFRVFCLGTGALGLFLLGKISGQRMGIPRNDLRPLVLSAALSITGWHIFSAFGISLMAAGRAAILAYTMPLWAVLMAWLFLGERMTRARIAGLVLGLAAIAVLIGGEISALHRAPWGALCMVGSAITWAAGTVVLKSHRWSMATTVLTAWQMVIGGIPVLIGFSFAGHLPSAASIDWSTWLALAYAATIPMVLCHWAWNRLVFLVPAGAAAIGTLMIPVVGLISSAPVMGEAIGPRELTALGLVVSALAIVLVIPAWRARRISAAAARS